MSKLHVKLDIQLFAANMSISCSTVSQNIANNTSTVRVTVRIWRTSGSTNWIKPYYRTLTINCDGQSATHSTELPSSKSEVYYSSDFTVKHSSDGTKYIEYSASLAATSSLPALSASGSTWLTTIPRYTSTTAWSIASRTETSITLNWTTANTCSQIRYGTSTSSYNTIDVNSSSGQVTISGLTANTPYNLYFMPRRSDSGLWGNGSDNNWSSLSNQYTHDYPKAEEITAFTIGTTKTNVIKLNNPLNRQVTITLNLSNNNTYTLYTGTGNGYISAEFFTTEATTTLYNSIPSARSGIYSCSVYCSATSTTKISGTNTYSIKNDGTENPTFDASNWSYVADLTSLTNNNQVVINGQSTLTFTVNTAAQAKYGASIKEYRFKWGNASKSSTLGYTVSQGNGNILTVEAIDTRELSTVITKTLSSGVTYLPYLLPNLEYNFCNTHRTDGITSEVKLNLYGTLSLTKFGETGENNSISSASYRVYDYDIADWTQYFPIPVAEFTYSNNVFRLEDYIIHADGSSSGFTIGKRYLVQVQLKDGNNLLGTFTSQDLQITDGKISRDVFQDINGNYHQGINGLADDNYAETIHGDINVIGDYYQNGQPFSGGGGVSGDTLPIGSQIPYGSTNIPNNWLLCDGSAVSRTEYADLFRVIGTSYGAGDGSTTFNLPDKRGRKSVGYSLNDTDFNAIGKKGGEKTHQLSVNELPSHDHMGRTYSKNYDAGAIIPQYRSYARSYYPDSDDLGKWKFSGGGAVSGAEINWTVETERTGNNQPHNNEDPYETDCWIIKAFQSAGVVAEVANVFSTSQTDTYSCNYMNGQLTSLLIKHESYIQLGLNSRYDRTTQSWTNMVINYNRTDYSNGNLTRSGNGVVIGAGISRVLAIGICVDGASQTGNEHDTGFIVNNATRYGHTYSTAKNELRSQTIASIIPVNQGDVIQHYVNTGGVITVTQYETSRFIVIAIA